MRLPEEDDLFGLGMTGFVPGEPAGSAAAGHAQSLDSSLSGLALRQASAVQRDAQRMQQHDGSGVGFGAADGRRPTSAGLATADFVTSPLKYALVRKYMHSLCTGVDVSKPQMIAATTVIYQLRRAHSRQGRSIQQQHAATRPWGAAVQCLVWARNANSQPRARARQCGGV